MSKSAPELMADKLSEVEQLALLSKRDGGPISEALLSRLLRRGLVKTVRRGTNLSPVLHYILTPLGQSVADVLQAARSKQRDGA